MKLFQKVANIAVWIAAAVMALYLAVQNHIEQNPFPTSPSTESVSK